MRLFPFLLAVPLLLSTGCAKQKYATKLKLNAIKAPQVLAPVDATVITDSTDMVEGIEKMTLADPFTALGSSLSTIGITSEVNAQVDPSDSADIKQKKQTRLDEIEQFETYQHQAFEIKRAQLEDGDSSDGSGEVKERLDYARQSWANIAYLNKGIPGIDSFAGSQTQTAVAPPPGAAANLTPAEAVWVRTCHEGMNGVKTSSFTATLKERYYDALPWKQAKEQYEALLVPPRFAKADVQFRQGYDKAIQALPILEQAQRDDDYKMARQADGLLDEANDFMDKGFAEVKAAGGE